MLEKVAATNFSKKQLKKKVDKTRKYNVYMMYMKFIKQ